MLTLGMFTGLAVGDNLLVRRYNFTEGEGWLVRIGAVAGGLIAVAPAVAASSQSPSLYLGLATLGAVIGMSVTVRMVDPVKESAESGSDGVESSARRLSSGIASVKQRPGLTLSPQNLLLLLAAKRQTESRVSLVSITF
jgi:hypothetical protein